VLLLWIKAFHIVAVVCWFAAMFYLPRLFVYHVQSTDTISIQRFELMERKLYRGIMTPAMIATWALGLWMIWLGRDYYLMQHWMHAKLGLVFLLTGYHFSCGYFRKALIANPQLKSHVYFRFFNEIPILLLIAVVILVVVKPQF
jgi:putative membrane protein